MNLKSHLAVAAIVALLITPLFAEKGEKKKKDPLEGIKCPISGKDATKCAVAYKDGKVFFCCPKCAGAFKEDPEKHAVKANQQLYATKQAKLVRCVFTCKDLNPETAVDIGGTKVCFCCEKCKEKACGADDPVACVFNDKQFANGFEVAKKEKKAEKKAE